MAWDDTYSKHNPVCGHGGDPFYGCGKVIEELQGHVVFYPDGKDVAYHLRCCPCAVDPDAVRPWQRDKVTT